ncbi:hypothetical protein KUTeg_017763 [Tegillarca granosa]|uniref:KY-like immunoglobulin-like domain-containing protein n=1 Tax=Tegillarca granosa TaxID=220873 RepID=A0ABQ9EKV3_TEGGR|nr:hypothetical protein KUTeg_017763 [Tegillarca granosa]
MGSGCSNQDGQYDEVAEKTGEKILISPEKEKIQIPLVEKGYPPPKPPHNKKHEYFDLLECREADNIARKIKAEDVKTIDELAYLLTDDLVKDLYKVRAIFSWLGNQMIFGRNYDTGVDPESPLGYMKRMHKGKVSYSTFFTLICRAANIPCVIIPGLTKGLTYEPGDKPHASWRNMWNAVHVAGSWRLVFPLWAYRVLIGQNTFKNKGAQSDNDKMIAVNTFNEYYFLTEPSELAFRCLPDDEKWQLLAIPFTKEKFLTVPYLRPMFFESKLKIISTFECVLKAEDGKCKIVLKSATGTGLLYSYDLLPLTAKGPTEKFNNFVGVFHEGPKATFKIRFPKSGVYKFDIVGGPTSKINRWICSFKITCDKPLKSCQPYPSRSRQGFGPCIETYRTGFTKPSVETGLIIVKSNIEHKISFTIGKKLDYQILLLHNNMPQSMLSKHVWYSPLNNNLTVTVSVPHNGEYALRIYVKDKTDTDFRNVCNYLLHTEDPNKTKKKWEDLEEKHIRHDLRQQTSSAKDPRELQTAIDKFNHKLMNDHGDLTEANFRLAYLKNQTDLRDAIKVRKPELLKHAVRSAKQSAFAEKLQNLIRQAQSVLADIESLQRFAHYIDLRRPAISELQSYANPPPVVIDVVRATYMLLGEPPEHLNTWENLQNLLRKKNDESLVFRIDMFDFVDIGEETIENVADLLSLYNEETAMAASVGVGAIYTWAKNVCEQWDAESQLQLSETETPRNFGIITGRTYSNWSINTPSRTK